MVDKQFDIEAAVNAANAKSSSLDSNILGAVTKDVVQMQAAAYSRNGPYMVVDGTCRTQCSSRT